MANAHHTQADETTAKKKNSERWRGNPAFATCRVVSCRVASGENGLGLTRCTVGLHGGCAKRRPCRLGGMAKRMVRVRQRCLLP